MALTTYPAITLTSGGGANSKGAYVEIVASTPYDSSRLHVIAGSGNIASVMFLIDLATGAAGSETVVVSNLAIAEGSLNTVIGQGVALDVDIPAGARLSARCQASTGSDQYTIGVLLEDRPLASLTNPVTYGANTVSTRGTQVDPGATAGTKGAYVQFSASTSARLDAIALSFSRVSPSQTIAAFQSWLVDVATGAAAAEVVVIPNVPVYCSPTDDHVNPVLIRLPIAIPAGTRLAVRCQCNVNTATQRILCVTAIGMQEPAPSPSMTTTTETAGVRTNANGSLVVETAGATQGPIGPLAPILMLDIATAAGAFSITARTAGSVETRLINLGNLRGCVDSAGALCVAEKTAGSIRTPLAPFANVRGRTDEAGNLLVCRDVSGAAINPSRVPLTKARVSTDEHGYLYIAEAP